MGTTETLIKSYILTRLKGYKDLRVTSYSINGSIIKIEYNYIFDWDISTRSYDNYLEVDLLDYITFVFNNK